MMISPLSSDVETLSSLLHWQDSLEVPRCYNALPDRRHDAYTCKQSEDMRFK